jgi:Trypsin
LEELSVMRRKLAAAAALALVTALMLAGPVGAVRFGQADNGEHPYVGELLFYVPDAIDARFDDPGGWFSCSGTLLSPTVIVTAGHCTFGIGLNGVSTTHGGKDTTTAEGGDGGNDVWIDFSEAAHFTGFPASGNYGRDENQQRYQDRAAWLNANANWHRGTAHPHPLYDDNQFWAHDAGIVVLDEPVSKDTYGALPTLNWLNQYSASAHSSHSFEVVGYGVTKALPFGTFGGDTRLKGLVILFSLSAQPPLSYAVFSNTPSARATGGTCFGDSGGPVFDSTSSNVVVAVNSWVRSSTCSGQAGGYRLDQPDDLSFVGSYLH